MRLIRLKAVEDIIDDWESWMLDGKTNGEEILTRSDVNLLREQINNEWHEEIELYFRSVGEDDED